MGNWMLYAVEIAGAWTLANAVLTLAETLGEKKDRLSGGAEKRSVQTKSAK